MSQRFVYLIDADANLTSHLVGELHRYGFRIEAAADSNDLMLRKDDLPLLIVLCIDPKRTGWAVCNRLRKSNTLKSTPLIITSAEATEKDFEDHKKLKTRAEEYLHKPFGVEALVEKIGGLIGMPDGASPYRDELEIPMESEEVAIEDDGSIIEEAEAEPLYGSGAPEALYGTANANAPTNVGFLADEEDRTRIGVMNIDGEVDMETEAAFAAIGAEADESTETHDLPPEPLPEARSVIARMPPAKKPPATPPPRASAMDLPLDESFGDDDDPFALPHHEGTMPPALPPTDALPMQPLRESPSEPLDLGLDDVARQASAEPTTMRPRTASQPRIITSARNENSVIAPLQPLTPAATVTANPADTAAHDTGAAAVLELRRERDQLRRDVEELQRKLATRPADAPPATSGFSREREFLNLREVINKKEKEVLDLRDSNDAKERLLLDTKDKIRELDRKAREADEHSLGTEKDLVAAREKIEALQNDKERSVERERQVKARLDDALKSIQRYDQELEGWKQKHANDAAAAAQVYNDAMARHEGETHSLHAQHQAALDAQAGEHGVLMQRASDTHEEDKALLVGKHEEERARMESELADQLQKLRDSSQNEREGIKLRLEQQLADQLQQHESLVGGLRSDHSSELQRLKQEQSQALAEKEQLHTDEIAGLRARHTKDSKEVDRRHQEESALLHERYKGELQAADERRQAELNAKGDEHRAEVEQVVADHTAERQRLEDDHIAALHTLDERRQSELREAAEAHANEVTRTRTELEQKLADELKAARDQHMRKMQALEESHADLKTGMQQRHQQATDELKKEHAGVVADYDSAIAQRDTLITDGHTRIGDLEQQVEAREGEGKQLTAQVSELDERLKSALDDINARETTLNERALRIAELEKESASYQEQILKAYQRIKSDESIVSRAKKALAIALTLLDESAPDGGDEASS
jgi:CheY-like chemotaxis protein